MAKANRFIGGSLLLMLLCCGTLLAQSAVEYGLGAGRAATTTSPARGIGSSMSGIWSNVGKTIDSGQSNSTGSATTVTPSHTAKSARTKAGSKRAPATAVAYEDASSIRAGMTYEELTKRFGPPSMSVTSGPGRKTLRYSGKRGQTELELQDGKVVSVNTTEANTAESQQPVVVLLQ
ncbi:MAG TPA: hypothetical protein VG675_16980 [Bryobacteraceae bacterium]|nr:hypothetical protein [Bryobacteraceae bacterium]